MPNTRIANAVRLELAPGSLVHANLSGAAFTGDWLWVAGDEACGLDRLRRLDPVGARSYALARYATSRWPICWTCPVRPRKRPIRKAWPWLLASSGWWARMASSARTPSRAGTTPKRQRGAKVALDGNRRLLACLPIEPDAGGEPCLVRHARGGRRALRLTGDSQANLLTEALADDPHFGPYMAIPGKDNGFDIEGLVVDGRRLLLGLRGPVLRGWLALLEIAVDALCDLPTTPLFAPRSPKSGQPGHEVRGAVARSEASDPPDGLPLTQALRNRRRVHVPWFEFPES